MKRLLSLVVSAALLVSTPGLSFASTGADYLKQYAFVKGNEKGDLMVNAPLTRAEACVLLAEIYGEKEQAQKYDKASGFKDIKKGQWFYGFITYAQSKGWVKGYSDGTFKPKDTISAKEWSSMLMKALSYDVTWATVEEDLLTLGIVVTADDKEAILRGEAFEAMWQTVNTPRNGKDVALGVELGKLESETKPVESFKITQGSVTSLREITLQTTVPLDDKYATDLRQYEVSAKGIYDLSVKKVTYDKAQGKLQLFLNKAVPQQTDVAINIKKMVSETGAVIENRQMTVTLLDVTPPTVVGAKTIGKRAIKVTFSEPLMSRSDQDAAFSSDAIPKLAYNVFSLNDGKISISDVTLLNNQKEAIIETYADLTGTIKVKSTEGLKDYFGFKVANMDLAVTYTPDTTAPMVVTVEDVSPVGVTLVFNEDIKIISTAITNYYHTNTSTYVDEISSTKHLDGNRLRLNFTRNILSSGTNVVYLNANIIQDYSGNKNAMLQATVTLEKDTVKPVVNKVYPVSESLIRAEFSEALFNRNGEAQSRANFKFLDEQGRDMSHLISTVVYRSDLQAVDIAFTQGLRGLYKLDISGVKDYSENVVDSKAFEVTMKDLTPPDPSKWTARVYNTGKADQMIKIKFDEPMLTTGSNSMLLSEKYIVNGIALDKLDSSLLRMDGTDDYSAVVIYYPGKAVNGGVDFTVNTASKIEIGRLSDAGENYIRAFSTSLKLEGKGYMDVLEVAQVGRNQVAVTLSDLASAINMSDFIVEGNGKTYTAVDYQSETVENRKTKITMTMSEDLLGDSKNLRLRILSNGTSNMYGETLNKGMTPMALLDKMKPFVQTVSFDGVLGNYVTYTRSTGVAEIKFSEAIDPRTVSLLSFTIGNFKVNDIKVEGNGIKIYLDAADRDKVSLYDTIVQKVEVRDLSGNGVTGLMLNFGKIYP